MAINIKNLEERIQKKAHLVDSNTAVDDLTDMVEAALLLTGSLKTYADSSELPTATGSNEKIGFIQDIKAIRFNNGKEWVTTASGEVQAPGGGGGGPSYVVQGSTYGWSQGGYPGPANYHNQIQRYAFASSDDAVDQGDLLSSQMHAASVGRTATSGLRIGGRSYPGTTYTDALTSYPFASGSNVVASPGTLSAARAYGSHTPIQGDTDYAYVTNSGVSGVYSNEIFRVATTLDASEADVGDLTITISYGANSSSGTNGYTSGGYHWPPTAVYDVINKFPFAVTANATDIGNLTVARYDGVGASSTTHGYQSGGINPSAKSNVIDKYAFASDGDATDVGDLQQVIQGPGGSSGPTDGFEHGGLGDGSAYRQNRIQKFSYSSDGNSTDLGDLVARSGDRPGSTEN